MRFFRKKVKETEKLIDVDKIFWLVAKNEQEAKVKVIPFVYADSEDKITVLIDGRTFELRDYKLTPKYKELKQKYPEEPTHFDSKQDEFSYKNLTQEAKKQADSELYNTMLNEYYGEGYQTIFADHIVYEPAFYEVPEVGVNYKKLYTTLSDTIRKYTCNKFKQYKPNIIALNLDKIPKMVEVINKCETKNYQK